MTTRQRASALTLAPGGELVRLLHVLWTEAVGKPGYNKREWMRLEELREAEAPAEDPPPQEVEET